MPGRRKGLDETTKPRVRVNAKQTSKGAWYFEATAESENVEESTSLLLAAVQKVEADFLAAGKTLATE